MLPSALMATAWPNSAFIDGFDAFRYACCTQFAPLRTNTYAAPEPSTELSFWLPLTRAGAAAFVRRADDQRIAVAAQRRAESGVPVEHAATAEMVARLGVGGLEICELSDLHVALPGRLARAHGSLTRQYRETPRPVPAWPLPVMTPPIVVRGAMALQGSMVPRRWRPRRWCRLRWAEASLHRNSPCARSPYRCLAGRHSRVRSD